MPSRIENKERERNNSVTQTSDRYHATAREQVEETNRRGDTLTNTQGDRTYVREEKISNELRNNGEEKRREGVIQGNIT